MSDTEAEVQILSTAGTFALTADRAPIYAEQLRVPALSVGTYSLPAGSVDDQSPHDEAEIYVVTQGRASFIGGGDTARVAAGDVIFVPAGEPHRFFDIEEDLALLVIFGPAYGSSNPRST